MGSLEGIRTKIVLLTIVDIYIGVNYSLRVIEVRETEIFTKWFVRLKDRKAKARIQARIDRIELGNLGDISPVERVLVNREYSMGLDIGSILLNAALLL